MCIQLHELLRHIIWVPPCLLLIYNTYSCYHLALQKPPTISQLTHIGDRYIGGTRVFSVAIHLGCSHSFCEKYIPYYLSQPDCCTRDFIDIFLKWLNWQEGTGELPRTRDTVMKAFQKLSLPHLEYMKRIREILMQE